MDKNDLMIVGRHRLLCDCLAATLPHSFESKVYCEDLRKMIKKIRNQPPDLLLIELTRKDEWDLEAIRELRQILPDLKIVVFGLPNVEDDLLSCFEAGASGCVVKEASIDQLQTALERALRRQAVLPPELTCMLFSRLADLASDRRGHRQVADLGLTPREVEILYLIADGLSNQQIADRLCLSLHTVKNHVHNILEKLEVKDRLEAVEKALQARWPLRRGAKTKPLPMDSASTDRPRRTKK